MESQFWSFAYIALGLALFYAITKFSNIYSANKKIKFMDEQLLQPKIAINRKEAVSVTESVSTSKKSAIEISILTKKLCMIAAGSCNQKQIAEEFAYSIPMIYEGTKTVCGDYLVDSDYSINEMIEKFEYEEKVLYGKVNEKVFITGNEFVTDANFKIGAFSRYMIVCFNALNAERAVNRIYRMDSNSARLLFLLLSDRMVLKCFFTLR